MDTTILIIVGLFVLAAALIAIGLVKRRGVGGQGNRPANSGIDTNSGGGNDNDSGAPASSDSSGADSGSSSGGGDGGGAN